MKSLFRAQYRALLRAKWVTTALVLSLSVGTMSVYVIHEISDRIVSNLDRNEFRHTFSHYIVLRNRHEDAYFDIRQRWRQGELQDVTAMIPVIEGSVEVKGRLVPVLGLDMLANFSDSEIYAGSQTSLDALLAGNTVISYGGALDADAEFLGARVVEASLEGRNFLLADITTAQAILGRPHQLDSVWLRTEEDTSRSWYSKLIPGIETALNLNFNSPQLDGFVVNSMSSLNPSRHFSLSIAFNLGQLGLLAMFVAAFIFYQAVRLNLDRRGREFERLGTLGVDESQITVVVCIEAVILATIASVLGFALGMLFLILMTDTSLNGLRESLTYWSVGKGFGLALVVAAVGSLLARRPRSTHTSTKIRIFGSFTCVLAVLFGFSAHSGLFGAFLLMVALCVLTALITVPFLVWLIARIYALFDFGSNLLRMTMRSSFEMINSIRTIVAAFSIAIAMPMGIGLLVDSYRTDFQSLLDERLTPGLYVNNAADVDIDPIRSIQGVETVRQYRRGSVLLPHGVFEVTVAELDGWELKRYGAPSTASRGVLVNEFASRNHGLRVGDVIEVRFSDSEVLSQTVSHVFSDFGASSPRIIWPNAAAPSGLIRDRLTILGSSNALMAVENKLRQEYPEAELSRTDEIRSFAVRIFDQTFALTLAMSNLSLIVAILGLASSLFVLSSQRDITFRVLHGVGVSPSKLVLSTTGQCLILGFVAVICAIPLSIGIAWALCELVNPRAFSSVIHLQFSPERLLWPALLGLVAAALAGLAPYRESIKRVIGQPQLDAA